MADQPKSGSSHHPDLGPWPMTLLSDAPVPSLPAITNEDLQQIYWDASSYELTPEFKRLVRRGLSNHQKVITQMLLDRFTPEQLKEAANRYRGRDFMTAPSFFKHFYSALHVAAFVADAYQTNPNALEEYEKQERLNSTETDGVFLSFAFLIGIGALIVYAIIRTHTHLTGLPAIGLSILVGGGGAIAVAGLLAQPAAEGVMTSLIGALAFVGMFALPILLLLLL